MEFKPTTEDDLPVNIGERFRALHYSCPGFYWEYVLLGIITKEEDPYPIKLSLVKKHYDPNDFDLAPYNKGRVSNNFVTKEFRLGERISEVETQWFRERVIFNLGKYKFKSHEFESH